MPCKQNSGTLQRDLRQEEEEEPEKPEMPERRVPYCPLDSRRWGFPCPFGECSNLPGKNTLQHESDGYLEGTSNMVDGQESAL